LDRGSPSTCKAPVDGQKERSEGIVDFLKSLASDRKAPAAKMEAKFFAKGRSY
jgi:hypothetical protein